METTDGGGHGNRPGSVTPNKLEVGLVRTGQPSFLSQSKDAVKRIRWPSQV